MSVCSDATFGLVAAVVVAVPVLLESLGTSILPMSASASLILASSIFSFVWAGVGVVGGGELLMGGT